MQKKKRYRWKQLPKSSHGPPKKKNEYKNREKKIVWSGNTEKSVAVRAHVSRFIFVTLESVQYSLHRKRKSVHMNFCKDGLQ